MTQIKRTTITNQHRRDLSKLTISFLSIFLVLSIFWFTSTPKVITSSSSQSQIQRSDDSQSHDKSINIISIGDDGNSSKIPINIISTNDDDENTGATPVIGTHSLVRSSSSSHNIEMVYALPPHPPTTKQQQPPPIALLLHGCTHSSVKFFSPSPDKCPTCLGLSEELAISRALLQRGYAIVAVTSVDRQSGCWGGERDVDNIKSVLNEMRDIVILNETMMEETAVIDKGREEDVEDSVERLIVVAVGASSGGRFAGLLAAEGVVDAAIVEVMSLGDKIRSRLMTRLVEKGGGLSSSSSSLPPPIYLAPMPRDEYTTHAARQDWEIMTTTTTATEKYPVVFDDTSCLAVPVTHHYLHGRVPNLDSRDAALIVKALAKAGHIDSRTFLLIKDPKKSDWEGLLQRECGDTDKDGEIDDGSSGGGCLKNQVLQPGKSPLAEALFRAWGFHEYCSEVVPIALDYIESELGMNVA